MDDLAVTYGFYETDLLIEYGKFDLQGDEHKFTPSPDGFYQIIYFISGSFEVKSGVNTFVVPENTVIISDNNTILKYRQTTKKAEKLTVFFLNSTVTNNSNDSFLRAFENLPNGTLFNLKSFSNNLCEELLLSLITKILEKRERFYMLLSLKSLIAEFDFKCDKITGTIQQDIENISVSLVEYVNNNYTKNISLKTLRDKYFICNSSINRIFKQYYNTTFLKYLNELRLKNANKLIKNPSCGLSIVKISESCGYKTYSTFYREYLKKYNVTPLKDYDNSQTNSWSFGGK